VNSPELMLTYGVLLGLMQGTNGGVYAYYFGRAHLGSISGFAATLMVAGTAMGPLLFALGLERFGSYTLTLALSSLLPLAIALVALGLELRQQWRSAKE